ncbi:hypothetical protein EF879_18805 [Micromonospora sp. HM5-17]|nr:hypothetical protein EF879_18805 [Micromonospora sp. HM5-17]
MSSERAAAWDVDGFRKYVIGHAQRARVAHDQASLAKLTKIDSGLLGRYFRGEIQPGPANLRRIQTAIPGTTMQELLVLAGRAERGQFDQPQVSHPLAQEVDRLLGDKSPLPEEERRLLVEMLERILDKYSNVQRIA